MRYTDLKQHVKTQCTKFQREFGNNEKIWQEIGGKLNNVQLTGKFTGIPRKLR